jgi:hypothetical protein
MFTLGNKLNRLYSLYLPFNQSHCEISVIFNKSNSFIGFNVDQENYLKSRRGEIKSFTFPELMRSGFASTFLDIRDFKSKNLDIKQQFHNILPEFKDKIHYETNETIKLSKIQTPKGTFESCMYIYVFRLTDFGEDFLYALVERQHIDVVLDKKIVRTASVQMSTNEAYEDLTSLIESSNRDFIKKENIDSFSDDIFEDRQSVI